MWVIDTDSTIKLFKTYNPAYFAGLWDELEVLIDKGRLLSTIVNYQEIQERSGQEWLIEWKAAHKQIFREIDDVVQGHVVDILKLFPDLIDQESDTEQADPYLIGMAIKEKAILITEETPLTLEAMENPARKTKMKIPNVCAHYGIATMNLIQFVNSAEWRKGN